MKRLVFNKEIILKPALCFCALLIFYGNSRADLLFYEGFDYRIGSKLAGQSHGFGFTRAWEGKKFEGVEHVDKIIKMDFAQDKSKVTGFGHEIQSGRMSQRLGLVANPGVKQVRYFSCFFQRDDGNNNEGNEWVCLFGLRDHWDKVMVSAGFDSQEKMQLVLGGKTVTLPIDYEFNKTYFFVGKIVFRRLGQDELHVSLFDIEHIPASEPEKWQGQCLNAVDGVSSTYYYEVGKYGGFLKIDEIKVAASFEDILPFSGIGRRIAPRRDVYKSIKYAPDVIAPFPKGFSNVSILPWSGRNVMDIILTNGASYSELSSSIHHITKAADADRSNEYPFIYDSGSLFNSLPTSGSYVPVNIKDDMFDVIEYSSLMFYKNMGSKGKPFFEKKKKIKMKSDLPSGSGKFFGDINSDGVIDLLIVIAKKEGWGDYWPNEAGPWGAQDQPDMGAGKDYENVGPALGYDIEGHWLGKKITNQLYWAEGSMDSFGNLGFNEMRPVYSGLENYPLRWRTWRSQFSSAVITVKGKVYLVLCGDTNIVLVLERIRNEKDQLHFGKAKALLEEGKHLKNTHLASIAFAGNMDSDEDTEIILQSGADGRLVLLEGCEIGKFVESGYIGIKGGFVTGDTLVTPCRGDWDGDGFPDIITGDGSGIMRFIKGTDDSVVYRSVRRFESPQGLIRKIPGPSKSIQGPVEQMWGYIQPTIGDWDGDGQLEIITNDSSAEMVLWRRTEEVAKVMPEPFTIDGRMLPAAWRSRPAIIDAKYNFAGDDRACILFLDGDGELAVAVPEHKGGAEIEIVVKLKDDEGNYMRLCGPHDGLWGRTKLSICDWDQDGLWDVVFGAQGTISDYFVNEPFDKAAPYWMKNIGTNEKPVFEHPVMIRQKDGFPIKVGKHNFSVWPTDINEDGKPDIVAGEERGRILYWFREELKW